jgi:hypothetical protein
MRFREMLVGIFSSVLLFSGVLAAWPQEVPVLDLSDLCRGIAQGAAGAGERGGPRFVFCTLCEERASNKKKAREDVVQILPRR